MMYGEYDDYFDDPSEFEAVLTEAQNKLQAILKDSVKAQLDEYTTALDRLDKARGELAHIESEKEKLLIEIKQIKEDFESRKYAMVSAYADSFIRPYTGGFVPGQKVWIVDGMNEYKDCDLCKGKGTVQAKILDETMQVKCPKCNPGGRIRTTKNVTREVTIDKVRFSLCFEKERVKAWTLDTILLRGWEDWIPIKRLYATKEEAERAMAEKGAEKDGSIQADMR